MLQRLILFKFGEPDARARRRIERAQAETL